MKILTLKITLFISILISFVSLNAQKIDANFDTEIWVDNFNKADTQWKQVTNKDEIYIIQENAYYLQYNNKNSNGIVLYGGDKYFKNYHAEIKFSYSKNHSNNASFGVVFASQRNQSGAFIIELKPKGEYRVSKYNGNKIEPISVDENGYSWTKIKDYREQLKEHYISIYANYKYFDLYVDGIFLATVDNVFFKEGKLGFMLSGGAQVSIKYIKVFGEKADSNKRVKNDEVELLNELIKILKNNIDELSHQKDSIQKISKSKVINSSNSKEIVQLKKDNKTLEAENKKLEYQLKKIKIENEKLQQFKKDIQTGTNGNTILDLTDLLQKEREKYENLLKKYEDLKQQTKE